MGQAAIPASLAAKAGLLRNNRGTLRVKISYVRHGKRRSAGLVGREASFRFVHLDTFSASSAA